nr:hypothetical protein [Tanacetum cinerariifolium]
MKRTGIDRDGRVIILPPTTVEEHIAVHKESKARTTLLQSIPDDHVTLTLKTKDELELLSFDDLYYKLKTLEVDVQGHTTFSSSQSAGPRHSAFIEKLDLEEMDLKWQMAMLSVRVHKFEQKARRKIDFDKKESARFNKKKTDHDGESDGVIASKEFGMIAGYDTEDAIKESAAMIYNLITGADIEEASTTGDAREFALMGVTSERNTSKNLFRLIDSSMFVRTKVGLGFNNCIRENELGWDDYAFSVFTTHSKDVEGRLVFCMFAKSDSMKVVPLPLSGDYTSLSDHSDLDESQMSYEVNTNNFASSDSSVKSSEPKPNNSTSCASTSSVSTSENEAEIESNENPFLDAKVEGIFDSGCFRSMTSNKERLDDFQVIQGEKVTFGGGEGRITGKGTIRTLTLDFENVYYDFKLPDESMVVVKVPRKHNLYTINLNNLCPRGNLACLVAHASVDESVKWHRRMGHVNYKNMNRLVKGNLVRGLPPKLFKNDHTCVACCKGTQGATTNPAGTQDGDSDSDCDEKVIIFNTLKFHRSGIYNMGVNS